MKRRCTSRLTVSLPAIVLLAGCATATTESGGDDAERAGPVSVTVMTFNVENLFDNEDDPGKDDKTYLPLGSKQTDAHVGACNEIEVRRWREDCLSLDWSDELLDYKLSVIARTIQQVDGGRGADIVALQEVENIEILERLRTDYLAASGYRQAILIEGTDARGIDVAFLTRLPLAAPPKLHALALPGFAEREKDTRGVLQADFLLPDGSILTGFSVHFPAPFHPTEMRIAAYEHLNALLAMLPDEHHAFAAGDFNTTSDEDAAENMLDTWARPYWTLAHDIGCDGCKGSHYYSRGGSWSFLDMILFAPARGENATASIRADSVQIADEWPAQVTADGRPLRFDATGPRGVSDHFPMVATFELAQKQ